MEGNRIQDLKTLLMILSSKLHHQRKSPSLHLQSLRISLNTEKNRTHLFWEMELLTSMQTRQLFQWLDQEVWLIEETLYMSVVTMNISILKSRSTKLRKSIQSISILQKQRTITVINRKTKGIRRMLTQMMYHSIKIRQYLVSHWSKNRCRGMSKHHLMGHLIQMKNWQPLQTICPRGWRTKMKMRKLSRLSTSRLMLEVRDMELTRLMLQSRKKVARSVKKGSIEVRNLIM